MEKPVDGFKYGPDETLEHNTTERFHSVLWDLYDKGGGNHVGAPNKRI